MYQEERIEKILAILKENGYVTVKYLTEELCYSNATINRDLNILEKRELVKRSYGGVELNKSRGTPLVFRYHKMRTVKNKIAKKAAEYIKDGDTIFIDGTTTCQYIGGYIIQRKNLKVITNNIQLVSYLSQYNINVICLGGNVVEPPYMLDGNDTVENAGKYMANKMFFSVSSVTDDGKVLAGNLYVSMHRTMAKNSNEVFLLTDSGKINKFYPSCLFDFDSVDYVISDYEFDLKTKKRFKKTKFIKI